MKKYLLLFLMLTIGVTAQSQVLITLLLGDKLNSPNLEFGLEGGINWTTISGLESKEYASKWNLGFYFDIRIKNQWSLYTGVLVKSNMGVDKLTNNDLTTLNVSKIVYYDGEDIEGVYSHKMNTFLVPALLRYKFKNHLYAELGPQFGLAYKSWIEFNSDVDGKDLVVKDFNKDKINLFDMGLTAGFGYTLFKGTGWTIGAKYYYGFLDVYKDVSGSNNSSFFLKLNIPIGAGEKPKKKDKTKG
ncbi:MAG: hypothetical protein B7C24_10925 [Bacteroidetes bacterium 4572_77]|nr:MAG: hypothetical protein B7C24_10925 [Bacteroidetes bacterium 4572_77]